MQRLTTDTPSSLTEIMLNFSYVKDHRVILRYGLGRENIDLCECIAELSKTKGCVLSAESVMEGACLECDDDCELVVLYCIATQAAELRERLKMYEDREETTGHWEIKKSADFSKIAKCSCCKEEFYYATGHLQIGLLPYCPRCGTKMRSEKQ